LPGIDEIGNRAGRFCFHGSPSGIRLNLPRCTADSLILLKVYYPGVAKFQPTKVLLDFTS
jgi:hypothetical protein